jgi:hypothetical protein
MSGLRTRVVLVASVTCLALATTASTAAVVDDPITHPAPDAALALTPVGTHETGVFEQSAAEIVVHHPATQRLFVVSAVGSKVDVLDGAEPADPAKLFEIYVPGVVDAEGVVVPEGSVVNSVAVRGDGLGVIAVEHEDKTEPGWLVFFDAAASGDTLGAVRVGALPDMVAITPDGTKAVVANEGEPAEDYSVDPEGSVGIVALPRAVAAAGQAAVRIADFHAFEGDGLPDGIRVFGGREDAGTGTPENPVSENLEPEYVAVEQQSKVAYVTLQEANGVAVVDLKSATVRSIWPVGTVDRMVVPFDPSDEDGPDDEGAINIGHWPVRSFRMPDAISAYQVKGRTYLVTADEGDSRDWPGYSEEVRVKDLGDDGLPPVCDSVAEAYAEAIGDPEFDVDELTKDRNLGRLKITKAQGLAADGGCYETLHSFGGRGISIWTTDGELVSSSGSEFEEIIAAAAPENFNSDHADSNFDKRSDDKGPEPEGVTIGRVRGKLYAFVGLERVGGIMLYDITRPADPRFVTYVNNRDFSVSGSDGEDDPEVLAAAGDLGPEGAAFIPADKSPTGVPLVVLANEVSGTTTLFSVDSMR